MEERQDDCTTGARPSEVRSTSLLAEHLHAAWRHLTLAYNTAKNAKKHDTASSIAYAIAEASACLEFEQSANTAIRS